MCAAQYPEAARYFDIRAAGSDFHRSSKGARPALAVTSRPAKCPFRRSTCRGRPVVAREKRPLASRCIADATTLAFEQRSSKVPGMRAPRNKAIDELAGSLVLGALLGRIVRYEIIDHWQQGEFHHDLVLRVTASAAELPGPILIVATNCNGGVKEVLCFSEIPDRHALWHARCPDNPEFSGVIPPLLAASTTLHWFDPCELLADDARSELREEYRERQCGGGWLPRKAPSS